MRRVGEDASLLTAWVALQWLSALLRISLLAGDCMVTVRGVKVMAMQRE